MLGLLGVLGFLGALGISGTKCAIENEQSKNETLRIDENGNRVCYDRVGRELYNGEKTYQHTRYDRYGNRHTYTVGVNSKKIYADSFDRRIAEMRRIDEGNKEIALRFGDLAYNKYDPIFDRMVTTEMSTGKVIACLYKHSSDKGMEYRKFYFNNPNPSSLDYDKTAIGDEGIIITEEEYEKLKPVGATYSNLPSDPQVLNKLWNTDIFK